MDKKKGGAPKGNQFARKHGFYSTVLDDAQRGDLEQATCVDGLDDEIALLRVKIKSIMEHDPDNIELVIKATNALVRMLRTKFNIKAGDKEGMLAAVGNVLRDIALPLGFNKNQITIGFRKQ